MVRKQPLNSAIENLQKASDKIRLCEIVLTTYELDALLTSLLECYLQLEREPEKVIIVHTTLNAEKMPSHGLKCIKVERLTGVIDMWVSELNPEHKSLDGEKIQQLIRDFLHEIVDNV